jgi:hypothetical protein
MLGAALGVSRRSTHHPARDPRGKDQIRVWVGGFDNLGFIALSSHVEQIKAERGISERGDMQASRTRPSFRTLDDPPFPSFRKCP